MGKNLANTPQCNVALGGGTRQRKQPKAKGMIQHSHTDRSFVTVTINPYPTNVENRVSSY